MAIEPFAGLRPAEGTAHAGWIVSTLTEPPGVSFRVPSGFEAILRIHHLLEGGRRWVEAFPELLVDTAHPEIPGAALDEIPVGHGHGSLDAAIVDQLVPLLAAATTTPGTCHYALWNGWGDLYPGTAGIAFSQDDPRSRTPETRREAIAELQWQVDRALDPVRAFIERCPVLPWWGGRDMTLFDGPVVAVATIGTPDFPEAQALNRRSPQWWWPADRAWFVASEIDDPWSYLAGPPALLESVRAMDLETVAVQRHHPW